MAKSREEKIEELKKILSDYVASGKRVEDLRKVDPEYVAVANAHLVGEDGHKLSMDERFDLLGFPREMVRGRKLTDEQWATKAKAMIKKYKDEGGRLEDLKKQHEIYQFVINRDLVVDGRHLSLEEKFTYLGEPRARKYAEDIEKSLREDIEEYLASGGSFHVRRKSLPFFERLYAFARKQDISCEEAMKNLGYKSYSDMYYRFLGLQDISKFCNKEGFFIYSRNMDNGVFHNYLSSVSETLQLPPPLVIMLLCDKKLESCYVETDYVEYLKNQLNEFAKNNNESLVGIRRKAPELYQKLRHFRTFAFNDLDDELTTEAVLAFMGMEGIKHRKNEITADFDISDELNLIREQSKGKVLSASDFSRGFMKKVYVNASRRGVSVVDYLDANGIAYSGISTQERFKKVKMGEYPYLAQMRERRDALIAEATVGKDLCPEEVFEQRVVACVQAYQEYKDRINSFVGKEVENNKSLTD